MAFFTNGCFSLGDNGEIESNRVFKDSNDLAKFIHKILDKHDDHPSINYTGQIYRPFTNFEQVNASEHGRGSNEVSFFLELEGEKCYTPSGNACFLKCVNYNFKRDFSMESSEFIQS